MSLQEILNLSASEKIAMVDQILDSLNEDEIQLTSNQKKELDRRMRLDEEGKVTWYSLAEVKSRLKGIDKIFGDGRIF